MDWCIIVLGMFARFARIGSIGILGRITFRGKFVLERE